MADSKSDYSNAATSARNSEKDIKQQREFEKSRDRHDRHVKQWGMNKVNLNEIVDKYAPGATGEVHGVKMIFYGKDYNVVADLASGYVRLIDARTGKYVNLNGKVDPNDDNTHFQIKKRKEM